MRSGLATRSPYSSSCRVRRFQEAGSPHPSSPVSSDRIAFWNDSWKVRPMAIASPTDFIWVVSSALAPGNFSKAKLMMRKKGGCV